MHPSQLIQISNFSPFTLRHLSTFLLSTIRAGAGWLASELASLSGGWTWQASEARQGGRWEWEGRRSAPTPRPRHTPPISELEQARRAGLVYLKTSQTRTVSAASRASHLLPGQHHPVNNPPPRPLPRAFASLTRSTPQVGPHSLERQSQFKDKSKQRLEGCWLARWFMPPTGVGVPTIHH